MRKKSLTAKFKNDNIIKFDFAIALVIIEQFLVEQIES